MPKRPASRKITSESGRLRIIGGEWRGRKLVFSAAPGLRPTPDRVRETLFNWLAPIIAGAHCLDLFAGSGALGLEALSRGAGHCHFVDMNRQSGEQIHQHLQTLQCDRASIHHSSAEDFLKHYSGKAFDIIFLDPPFGQQLLSSTLQQLADCHHLKPDSRIYLELAVDEEAPQLPTAWHALRDKTAGKVRYLLIAQ